MSKHTPGPWEYKPTSGYDYGSTIYWVPGVCHNVSSEANARLIAAAPELLESCKGLLGIAERHGWLHVAVDAARAAIAKAEGGMP